MMLMMMNSMGVAQNDPFSSMLPLLLLDDDDTTTTTTDDNSDMFMTMMMMNPSMIGKSKSAIFGFSTFQTFTKTFR